MIGKFIKNLFIFLFGAIVGFFGAFGGVAFGGYYLATTVKVGDVLKEGNEYVSDALLDMTLVDVVTTISESPDLGTVFELVPIAKTSLDSLLDTEIQNGVKVSDIIYFDTDSEAFKSVSFTDMGALASVIEVRATTETVFALLGESTSSSIHGILDNFTVYNEAEYSDTDKSGNFAFEKAQGTEDNLYVLENGVYKPCVPASQTSGSGSFTASKTATKFDAVQRYKLADGVTLDDLANFYACEEGAYKQVYTVDAATGEITFNPTVTDTDHIVHMEAPALKDMPLLEMVSALFTRIMASPVADVKGLLDSFGLNLGFDIGEIANALVSKEEGNVTISDLLSLDMDGVKVAELLEAFGLLKTGADAEDDMLTKLVNALCYGGDGKALPLSEIMSGLTDLKIAPVLEAAGLIKTGVEAEDDMLTKLVNALCYGDDGNALPLSGIMSGLTDLKIAPVLEAAGLIKTGVDAEDDMLTKLVNALCYDDKGNALPLSGISANMDNLTLGTITGAIGFDLSSMGLDSLEKTTLSELSEGPLDIDFVTVIEKVGDVKVEGLLAQVLLEPLTTDNVTGVEALYDSADKTTRVPLTTSEKSEKFYYVDGDGNNVYTAYDAEGKVIRVNKDLSEGIDIASIIGSVKSTMTVVEIMGEYEPGTLIYAVSHDAYGKALTIGELPDRIANLTVKDVLGDPDENTLLKAIATYSNGEDVLITGISTRIAELTVKDVLGDPGENTLLKAIAKDGDEDVLITDISTRIANLTIADIIENYGKEGSPSELLSKLIDKDTKITAIGSIDFSEAVGKITLKEAGINFEGNDLLNALFSDPEHTSLASLSTSITSEKIGNVPFSAVFTNSTNNAILGALLEVNDLKLSGVGDAINNISLKTLLGDVSLMKTATVTNREWFESDTALYTLNDGKYTIVGLEGNGLNDGSAKLNMTTGKYEYTNLADTTFYEIDGSAGFWFLILASTESKEAAGLGAYNYGALDTITDNPNATVGKLSSLEIPKVSELKMKVLSDIGLITKPSQALLYDSSIDVLLNP